jgi:hypothetical protein
MNIIKHLFFHQFLDGLNHSGFVFSLLAKLRNIEIIIQNIINNIINMIKIISLKGGIARNEGNINTNNIKNGI